MANKDDYLTDYRHFFENFAQTVNPNDQLPVKLGSYKLVNVEVVGGIIDWTTQYLTQRQCPQSLLAPLIKIIIDEVRKLCKKEPISCGFNPADNAYEPLKLMQTVMAKTNEICLRYLDNSKLCSLPTPGPPYNAVSAFAVKNNRRRMEDRHVIIHDLNSLFIEQETSPSSYYAIFDGHAGHNAAAYSCAHLHQFLGESKDFISNPEKALRDAFLKTDALFLDKCSVENLGSGTTAVCALHRQKEKTLYIAWVGDSQALLVSQGQFRQCVLPHKPCRKDEKERIEQQGGAVLFWGTWRVNGQLAVSRAIGDMAYKPYVTAVPDILEIPLSGNEDFLILACDGLWDFISEQQAARCVYEVILENPDDIDFVSQRLVQLAKHHNSSDNITVIVVFLRETSKIAAEAHWAARNNFIMDTLDNANNTNPFANSNNSDILAQKDGFVLNLGDNFKQNGTEKSPINDFLTRAANGKRSADDFDEDDDLGPETDVDAVDDIVLPSAITTVKNITEGNVNNNSDNMFDPFYDNKEEKATLETDTELQKQLSNDFDLIKSPREETPTPPEDSVHDASGLVDNVAESGEDSDDEWNYFKGDTAQKETISSSQTDKEVSEINKSDSDCDTMSQLNPNAAEFVPVSPKRNTASPVYQNLMDDKVLAQSPRRTTSKDIEFNVPNSQEFECEIKSRPSDVADGSDDDDNSNAQKLSSQELMENLLNGKSMDEIEFQPINTPNSTHKPEEFHFGPNATPFSTPGKILDQSEALSTKAVFGDESSASYLEDKALDNSFCENNESHIVKKDDDPMSMSFYQDKDEENPFNLNKVHELPENIEDFLEKPTENNSFFNETISDLPEHSPIGNAKTGETTKVNNETIDILETIEIEKSNEILSGSQLLIPDEVSDTPSPLPEESQSSLLDSHSPLIMSPVPGHISDLPIEESHNLIADNHTHLDELDRNDLQTSNVEVEVHKAQSPLLREASPLCDLSSPFQVSQSPVENTQAFQREVYSPKLETRSPIPNAQSPTRDIHSPLHDIEFLIPTTELFIPSSQSSLPVADSLRALDMSPELTHLPPVTTHSPVCGLPTTADFESDQLLSPTKSSDMELEFQRTASQSPALMSPTSPARRSPFDVIKSPVSQSLLPSESPVPVPQSPVFPTQSPIRDIESPIEDVTLSVKDSPILIASPVDDLIGTTKSDDKFAISYAQEVSNIVEDAITTEAVPESNLVQEHSDNILLSESCPISSPKSVISEQVDTESVVTADVNSFLERSLLPEVTSPLSPSIEEHQLEQILSQEVEKNMSDTTKDETINANQFSEIAQPKPTSIDIDIKSETIACEYPVHTITTPSEESKAEDIVQNETLSSEPFVSKEGKSDKVEAAPISVEIAAATTAAAVAAVGVATLISDKKTTGTKPKTTAALSKKPLSKTVSSPTKPTASKTATKPPVTKSSSTTATLNKVSQSKPTSTPPSKILNKPSKPKTSLSTKVPEKKPLSNGDVKPLGIKKIPSTTATRTAATKPVPNKLSPTKTTTETKSTISSTRPTTAPAKTSTTRNSMSGINPRPTSLTSKTNVTTTSKTTTTSSVTTSKNVFDRLSSPTVKPTVSTTRTLLSSPKTGSATAPKSRPPTAPLRSKPLPAKPAPKSADAEKQMKETTNKQITASRVNTSTRTVGNVGKLTTTNVRKIDTKATGTRLTVTKTTATTAKSTIDAKNPTELIRHNNISKVKSNIKKTKPQVNGITTEVETMTVSSTNNMEPQLMKDISPLIENNILDNSQILNTNVAD